MDATDGTAAEEGCVDSGTPDGCSQAVHLAEPALVRNYDYAPELLERVVLGTAFTGRRVVASTVFPATIKTGTRSTYALYIAIEAC